MPAYTYEARRPSGDLVSGRADAANAAALKAQLARKGLFLVSSQAERGRSLIPARTGKVKLTSLLVFLREFRALLNAGLPVSQTLRLLTENTGDPALRSALTTMRDGVEKGLPLDEAAAARPDAFDPVFQATLRAGVQTSQLGLALGRLESFIEIRAELNRRVSKAMAYPIFLLVLLVVVLAVLMLFVLPRFAELYAEFGSELPPATRVLIGMVESAPIWIPVTLALLIGAGMLWRRARARPRSRTVIDRFFLRLPVIGRIIRDIQLVQVSYMLSMLLRAGAPMKTALGFVAGGTTNSVIRARLEETIADVSSGRSLSDGLARAGLFPPASLGMIRAGDGSGALPDLLDSVAALHEAELEDRMARLLALIEPAMMLLVGVVLGAVIITVYLPVFGISGVVQ